MPRRALQSSFVCLVAVLMLAAKGNACQAEDSGSVDQTRVYTSYWLLRDEAGNTTSARAQFRFGHSLGTALELKDPAKVTFGDAGMAFNSVLNWHELKKTGATDGGVAFVYVNTGGEAFTNVAQVSKTADLPTDFPATLKRTEGFTLTWVGPPLTEGEDLELVVNAANNGADFIRLDQFSTGATSITVPADKLNDVGGSSVVVTIRRHEFIDDVNAPDAGGRLQLTYEAKPRTVALE